MAEKIVIFKDDNDYLFPRTKLEVITDDNGRSLIDVVVPNTYCELTISTFDWILNVDENEREYYVCTKTLDGAKQGNHPILSAITSDISTIGNVRSAFSLIYDAYTTTNSITFYASHLPKINFSVQVRGY